MKALAMARPIRLAALLAGAVLLAASAAPAQAEGDIAAHSHITHCATPVGAPTAAAADVAAGLLAGIDHNPLYVALVPQTGRPGCRLRFQDGGAVQLEVVLKGGTLTLRNDPGLESTEQRLRVRTPLRVQPEALLADAEHFLYGEKGCRIDWAQAETVQSSQKSKATETVWHGDVCNCRAGVEKSAGGRVTAVSIRSTC